jgi:hypothetical protein
MKANHEVTLWARAGFRKLCIGIGCLLALGFLLNPTFHVLAQLPIALGCLLIMDLMLTMFSKLWLSFVDPKDRD